MEGCTEWANTSFQYKTITEYDSLVCTPSTMATKKLHGRTLRTEMRLISHVRLVSNFSPNGDYPGCGYPTLTDISARVGYLGRVSHGAPRRVAKRDGADAFKRATTHPDCVAILRTEFTGLELGFPEDIVFLWAALPFGWSASPGYFQAWDRLVTHLRGMCKPSSPLAGNFPFSPLMFVDEAMIVDVDLPSRLEQTGDAWGCCCETVLGKGSVRTKEEIEGSWENEQILLGFQVNVETEKSAYQMLTLRAPTLCCIDRAFTHAIRLYYLK